MSCVINAIDFNPNTKDPLRDRWAGADMATVVRVLDGSPVAITTDKRTGHTIIGARLERVFYDSFGGPRVHVFSEGLPAEGVTFRVYECGMILPLDSRATAPGKYEALELFRQQRQAALKAMWDWAGANDAAGNYGKTTAAPMPSPGHFHVSYEPIENQNPANGYVPGHRLVVDVQVDEDNKATLRGVIADDSKKPSPAMLGGRRRAA